MKVLLVHLGPPMYTEIYLRHRRIDAETERFVEATRA